MKTNLMIAGVFVLGLTGAGCATKKYVVKTVSPVESRVTVAETKNAEQDDAADAQRVGSLAFFHQFVHGKLEIARHGADRLAHALTGAGEQGQDEVGWLQLRFAHQPAHGFRHAQPALAMSGKRHRSRL